MAKCLQCGDNLIHVEGRKKKRFCGSPCRNKWFYENGKKVIAAEPPKEAYDAPPLPPPINDEPKRYSSNFEKLMAESENKFKPKK